MQMGHVRSVEVLCFMRERDEAAVRMAKVCSMLPIGDVINACTLSLMIDCSKIEISDELGVEVQE